MVLVFSEAANNSDEIKKELSLASRYHVPVMALRTEDVEPNDAFAYELSTRQWIDAFESWDRSIDALVQHIGRLSAPACASAARNSTARAPPRPDIAARPRRRRGRAPHRGARRGGVVAASPGAGGGTQHDGAA